jgi:transcriptional regulator
MEKDVTTIQISKSIRDRLKELGKKGESYDEIIERLLQLAEMKNLSKKVERTK